MSKKFLCGLCYGFCAVVYAQSFDLEALKRLQAAGKNREAYQYAQAHLMQQEGNPEFDLYYGIAAIDSGHASQGVFALERVLLRDPDHAVARLELARGYFLLEEYVRAREEFTSVLALNPPKGVRQNIQRYLDAIQRQEGRYRTHWGGYLEVGAGSDDNVNSGPAEADIFVPFFGISGRLQESHLEQEDGYTDIAGGVSLDKPIAPGWSFFSTLDLNTRRHQDLASYDTTLSTLALGASRLYKQEQYRVSINTQQFKLDGRDYRDLQAVNLNWRHNLSVHAQTQVFLQHARLRYTDQAARDSALLTVGFGYLHEFEAKGAPLFFGNLYFGDENADNSSRIAQAMAERDFQALSLGLQLRLAPAWNLSGSYFLQTSEYGAEDLFFRVKRQDDYSAFEINLSWLTGQSGELEFFIASTENTSNITLNEYDRAQAGIHFRYRFN